jgi:hypothetical protein
LLPHRLMRPAALIAATLTRAAPPRSRAVCAAMAACIALAPSAARAQADEYKQRMDKGVKLFQDKNFEAAIVEFREAYAARPKASPLVNIALCYKGLFNYPKAIAALSQALEKHSDTMDEATKKAAQSALAEMRDLLAFVRIQVTPKKATITIDGEDQPAEAIEKPVPLGPGPHRIGARADGHAAAEQTITLASGEKDRVVELALTPDKGFVTIRTDDPEMAIAVDQAPMGYGEWSGYITPGAHLVQMYGPGKPTYNVQIAVAAGTTQEIRPGSGGVRLTQNTGASPPPPPLPPPSLKKKEEPSPPKRGPFALVTGSLLVPFTHPKDMPDPDTNSGGSGGIRLGYRVNTPASFDFMFEYGNVYTTNTKSGLNPDAPSTGDIGYTLSSFRFGLNLRLMTPGRVARFVGTIGGGLVYDVVDFSVAKGATCTCRSASGVDPFLMGELGLELDFGGVLVGAALQSYFQSSRGIKTDDEDKALAYESAPLVHLGGGLRVGYALW